MSRYQKNASGGTTDHAEEIIALRRAGGVENSAAAALLETHDDSGISLDDWVGPRELVNQQLAKLGYGSFLPNGV